MWQSKAAREACGPALCLRWSEAGHSLCGADTWSLSGLRGGAKKGREDAKCCLKAGGGGWCLLQQHNERMTYGIGSFSFNYKELLYLYLHF